MTKAVPAVIWLLVLALLLGAASVLLLEPLLNDPGWDGAAQIVAMGATLVMLVVVWNQLAVQTVVAILASAQEAAVREARGRLFAAEESHGISKLRCTRDPKTNQWQHDWEQTADEVCQSWSSIAFLLRIDPVARSLIAPYMVKARRAILKSHFIAQPRITQRRTTSEGGQSDLWDDFDWLAGTAAKAIRPGEADAWNLPTTYLAELP